MGNVNYAEYDDEKMNLLIGVATLVEVEELIDTIEAKHIINWEAESKKYITVTNRLLVYTAIKINKLNVESEDLPFDVIDVLLCNNLDNHFKDIEGVFSIVNDVKRDLFGAG